MTLYPKHRIRIFCRLFVLCILTVGAGCATYEVEGRGSISPAAITGAQTVHGSLYGYRWRPFNIEKCGTNSLFRVEVHTNALLLLTSVATLGLYVPQTVEWWCNSEGAADENEEVWVPPSATQ